MPWPLPADQDGFLDQRAKATGQYLLRTARQLDADLTHIEERNVANMSRLDKDISGLKHQILRQDSETWQKAHNSLTMDSPDADLTQPNFRRLRRSQSSETCGSTSHLPVRRGSGDSIGRAGALPKRKTSLPVIDYHRFSITEVDCDDVTVMTSRVTSSESMRRVSSHDALSSAHDATWRRRQSLEERRVDQQANLHDVDARLDTPRRPEQRRCDQTKNRRHSYAGQLLPTVQQEEPDNENMSASDTAISKPPSSSHDVTASGNLVENGSDSLAPRKHERGFKGVPEKTPRSIFQLRRISRGELKKLMEEK